MGAFILLMTQDRYQILVKPNILLQIEIVLDTRELVQCANKHDKIIVSCFNLVFDDAAG